MNLSVRRAQLADRAAIKALTLKADAELVADWGTYLSLDGTWQEVVSKLQSGFYQLPVAIDADNAGALVGYDLFAHVNPFADGKYGELVPDAWCSVLNVTDKDYALADRLTIAKTIFAAAAAQLDGQAVIWGDVKTGGNFDRFLGSVAAFKSWPAPNTGNVACTRYAARAATIRKVWA